MPISILWYYHIPHTPKIKLHRLSPILLTKFPCNHTHRPHSVIKSIIAFIMRYIRCDHTHKNHLYHENRHVNHFESVEIPHLPKPKQTAHAFSRIYWISVQSFRISCTYLILMYLTGIYGFLSILWFACVLHCALRYGILNREKNATHMCTHLQWR